MADPVELVEVHKRYPNGKQAVSAASISLDPGTFFVLLGPSGSGKTTLLRCVAGIERVTGGEIRIGGRIVASPRVHLPPERRDLAMVFQDYALWPHLSARDNVAFALKRRGVPREAARTRAVAMLGRLGIGTLADRYPSELSGGEQQRVGLARALIGDTGLLLCDEPLSNLDAALREAMRIEISSLAREVGTTTIYITHDQAEAFALADRIGVLEGGRLVQVGEPEDIYAKPASPFVARFTGLAGELPVRVGARHDGETLEVHPATPSALRPLQTHADDGRRAAEKGLLLIRAAAISLEDPSSPEIHLAGRVTDVAFRGLGYEHAVELDGGTRLNGIFSKLRARRGDSVGLRLHADGCHFFADDAQPPVNELDVTTAG